MAARPSRTAPGELAERQPDRFLQSTAGPERRQGDRDALLVRGHNIPGRVVLVGDFAVSCDSGGPPPRRADEMIDERVDVPRRTWRRRTQIVGLDLRQDVQCAPECPVQFRHLHRWDPLLRDSPSTRQTSRERRRNRSGRPDLQPGRDRSWTRARWRSCSSRAARRSDRRTVPRTPRSLPELPDPQHPLPGRRRGNPAVPRGRDRAADGG